VSESSWSWECSEDDSERGQTESETESSGWESGLSDVTLGSDNVFYSGAEGGDEHGRIGCKQKFPSD